MFVYTVPDVPILLTTFSLLYFLNVAEAIFNYLLEAGLLGSLALGIVYGPEVSSIVPENVLQTLLILGYIGLILLVFEAGLSTNIALLYDNSASSILVGGSGILLPIALSILVVHFGFGYDILPSFVAGASLSSTSLGTTLSLLKPELRQTRPGIVLLSAALFDDVVGLIIAAIMQTLSSNPLGSVSWQDIVRPLLVSVAFAGSTYLLVWALQLLMKRMPDHWKRDIYRAETQLFLQAVFLAGFVAGAKYAGTSELFGAYLSGVLVGHIFHSPPETVQPSARSASIESVAPSAGIYTPHLTFDIFVQPILRYVLSPIFFASIGSALPIRTLGSVDGSSRVVWRGFVYAFSMAGAKALTGFWLLIPPTFLTFQTICPPWRIRNRHRQSAPDPLEELSMSPMRSAIFVGLAMIARGEIALIISQIARPILTQVSQELYAIVIWAILLDTVIGAVGVGIVLRQNPKASG
ncbi:Cation/H+ exchanger [Lentinula edodes]|nr:Cation/H+ exchanger [Lentinula edodes]